jgi:hypothetical protein
MKCYAAGYCKLYNTDKCTNICDFKIVLDALYSLSNIPKRYRQDIPLRPEKADLESFHYLKDYKDHIGTKVDEGQWLYHPHPLGQLVACQRECCPGKGEIRGEFPRDRGADVL